MKLRTNYHRDTGTLSLTFSHRAADGAASWTSNDNTVWDMKPEQWLEIIGELRRAIDAIQLSEVRERVGDLTAELAAKIAEHGGAS